jgi:hypothetical protein
VLSPQLRQRFTRITVIGIDLQRAFQLLARLRWLIDFFVSEAEMVVPARAQLSIFYNEGKEQYQVEQMLAPDEQMELDFGKLIHDQVPDNAGHRLPPDLTSGAYRVRDLTDIAVGNL